MGIPAETFWKMNFKDFRRYEKADKIKTQKENYMMWLQGMYIEEAFGVVLSNALDKNSSAKYPEEPFQIFPLTKEEAEVKRKKALKELVTRLSDLESEWRTTHSPKGGENA